MSEDDDPKHDDPAVQALIDDGWLGEWDYPITVQDLVNVVRMVREASDLVDITGPVTVDIPEARALVIGPDDLLVVVIPQGHAHAIQQHREHLHSVLGNRFIIILGDDVMLAKVKDEEWGRYALDQT